MPRPPNSVLQTELLRSLPRILRKQFVHVSAIRSVGASTEFGVVAKQSKGRVSDRGAATAGSAVLEYEAAILVVRSAGNALYVDLVKIVLAGALEQATKLEGVVALYPSKVV